MQEEKSYSFQVNLKGMIALLSEHLYSDPNTFVRELLQNGVDAITALKHLDEQHQGKITIELPSAEQSKFIFKDNGIGLKEADIHQFLSVIGESSKSKDIKDAKDFIGKFGIGLLSCFVVSDEIIVETKSALEQLPLRWTARPAVSADNHRSSVPTVSAGTSSQGPTSCAGISTVSESWPIVGSGGPRSELSTRGS